jgi:hypothetical protein
MSNAEAAMPHTPEWLRGGNTIYTRMDGGGRDIWATFNHWKYVTDACEAAELAKVAMNERPRLLAQLQEEQQAHDTIARMCLKAGVSDPDGTSVGIVGAALAQRDELLAALKGLVADCKSWDDAVRKIIPNLDVGPGTYLEKPLEAIRKAEEADRERA